VATEYISLVTTYALDAIKNTGPLYSADQYLSSRTVIENALLVNVTNSLDSNIFCSVIDLQLRAIYLSADFQNTKLTTAIQKETNAMQLFVKDSEEVKEKTSLEVLYVNNQAIEVANAATASASLIKEKAIYEAKQSVEAARSNGLAHMINATGLTTAKHNASHQLLPYMDI